MEFADSASFLSSGAGGASGGGSGSAGRNFLSCDKSENVFAMAGSSGVVLPGIMTVEREVGRYERRIGQVHPCHPTSVADEVAGYAEEVTYDHDDLEHRALAVDALCAEGLGDCERPGKAEAEEHREFENAWKGVGIHFFCCLPFAFSGLTTMAIGSAGHLQFLLFI